MSDAPVQFALVGDALLRDPPITGVVELPVLGLPVRFETNSPQVLSAVEESFGCWRRLDARAIGAPSTGDVLRVRIVVYEDDRASRELVSRVPVRHICPDETRLLVHSSQVAGISDPARGEAVGYVTAALVADRAHFRAAALEALTYSLLAHFDRHPLHAAGVARGDRAVLLAASSGTGKSTVSYVAHRAGLALLSDDRLWVQRQPALRVWSVPGRLRLLPHAVKEYPELGAMPVEELDGKRKIAVDVGARGGAPRTFGEVAVCVMERGSAAASLERVGPAELAASFVDQAAPGFDRYPERGRAVVRALCAGGGWRLRLSPRAEEALPLLERMLGAGDG